LISSVLSLATKSPEVNWVDSTGRRNTGLEKEHKGL